MECTGECVLLPRRRRHPVEQCTAAAEWCTHTHIFTRFILVYPVIGGVCMCARARTGLLRRTASTMYRSLWPERHQAARARHRVQRPVWHADLLRGKEFWRCDRLQNHGDRYTTMVTYPAQYIFICQRVHNPIAHVFVVCCSYRTYNITTRQYKI